MSYLLRAPGRHRCCCCGWEGKPKDAVKAGKPVRKCPKCSEITSPIPLREIPGYCFCCASGRGKLLIIDHTMIRECRQCGARLNLHTVTPWIWEATDMQDAINKLQAEMAAAANDAYIQQVGGELLQIIAVNPGAAEKIMTPNKTIKGSYEAMEALAQKKAVNRKAMFTPDEGRSVILNYFGITNAVPAPGIALTASAAPVPPPTSATPPEPAGLVLDDLLGDL